MKLLAVKVSGSDLKPEVMNLNIPPATVASPRTLAPAPGFAPTLSTSAAAMPSGKRSFCSMISVRRSGTENSTPSRPPSPTMAKVHQ